MGFHRQGPTPSRTASLLYTDRSIYRPGQKLYWKVLAYEGKRDDARFRAAAQTPVTVWLVDPNGQKVETGQTLCLLADHYISRTRFRNILREEAARAERYRR